ncbi:hypothetical protein CEXT_639621 [Caerostris extrusa]|uniref:Uncharacterized protein n=1 Tax=Caerostris extrusa TaxID=172846 RepID=A0AAV4MCN9_CAEEX|nr:hypothetical protein CEXT_639621 [Caerostris extrusa]
MQNISLSVKSAVSSSRPRLITVIGQKRFIYLFLIIEMTLGFIEDGSEAEKCEIYSINHCRRFVLQKQSNEYPRLFLTSFLFLSVYGKGDLPIRGF